MNPKPSERIYPYPTTKDVASGIGCLLLIGCVFALPFIFFFWLKGPVFVFLAWLFPIILFLVLGQKIFGEFEAFRNRHRFPEVSLITNAKVIDHIWIRGESDDDLYQIMVEFDANTVSRGTYIQKLKFDVPMILYHQIGDRVNIRYSRLNPRIALLEGEAGSSQTIDARLYPGAITTMEYAAWELLPGAAVTILLTLIGIGLFLFSQEMVGKIAGICFAVFSGTLAWHLITMNSRTQRKQMQEMEEFKNTNVNTQAKILSILPTSRQLTIQFAVSEETTSPAQMTLVVNTSSSMFKNMKKGDCITVRYSPDNPRVVLIEGEF